MHVFMIFPKPVRNAIEEEEEEEEEEEGGGGRRRRGRRRIRRRRGGGRRRRKEEVVIFIPTKLHVPGFKASLSYQHQIYFARPSYYLTSRP